MVFVGISLSSQTASVPNEMMDDAVFYASQHDFQVTNTEVSSFLFHNI